jgi:Divergent InlB B-repeat domain
MQRSQIYRTILSILPTPIGHSNVSLTIAGLLWCVAGKAQNIAITPSYPGVKVGDSVQLTAKVTGLSNDSVTWAVNNIVGGNSTVGIISQAGLYTAPASVPPQTLVTATSKQSSSVVGADYINVLAVGPVITSIAPNPIFVGNFLVTIAGTGFQSGATVMQNYSAAIGDIPLTTTSITPTLITATGYQPSATSVSFKVQNRGSAPSNVLSATVKRGYQLTVVGGTGSGEYAAGTMVTLTANAPPAGEVFQKWTGATVASPTSATTTIKMPAGNTTVTANFAGVYTLTVVNGSGSGSYAAGSSVAISANAAPAGEAFKNWTGATVANATASKTTIKMPAANTTVTANFAQLYTLTVVNGTGSGSYLAGAVVNIAANAPPTGQSFLNWTGATVANASAPSTTLTMPAASTTVTANYSASYTLTVTNGSGGGSYSAGAVVTITANAPPAGQLFQKWTGATVANASAPSTTLTMPAANTTVTANYAPAYTLTVVSGTGSGSYLAGTAVNISANPPAAGQVFASWTGATVASATSASTTLTMPAANTTVTATYTTQPSGPASCSGMSLGANASLNGFRPFPSTNAWNTDISQAPLDPNNGAITSASGFAGLHLHHDFSSVAGGNYGIPYVIVDSSATPLVPINVIDYASESDVASAPYPINAPIEGSPADCSGWPDTYIGDSHVLVLDRNACMLYETFNTHRCNGAWNSSSETIWDLRSYDQRPWGWTSADAAGLPIFPGLVRYDEVAAGAINHAIRFTMQVTKNDANGGFFVEPASHAAGVYWGVSNVMGMRVRLKAGFDISGFSQANQVILTAMKKYGMILADNGGYFYFQGVPDPRWNDDDLVKLDAIQSSNFEVVQMTPTYPGYDSATAPTGAAPTITSFVASPPTVAAGTPVTLTWTTSNDSYDFIDKLGGVHGGTATATPTQTTTYTLNATNQHGRATAQVTVTVK